MYSSVQSQGYCRQKVWHVLRGELHCKRTFLLQNVLEETGVVSERVSATIWLRSFTGARREVVIRKSPVQLSFTLPEFHHTNKAAAHLTFILIRQTRSVECQSAQGLLYLLQLVPSWNTVHFLLPWTLWTKASVSSLAYNQESLCSLCLKYSVDQQGL